jgi:osmoprotectant transport system permease protein
VTRRARRVEVVTARISATISARGAFSLAASLTISLAVALAVSLAAWPSRAAATPRELRVGSKSFTESVILGEIVTELERASGTPARHQAGFGGTRLVWDALLSGAIDVYPEYTGTLVEELLAGARPSGQISSNGSSDLKSPDGKWITDALAARGIGLVGPLGFNDTYAIGVRRETAQKLGLRSIADLRAHPELRCGWSNEFMNRRDGWPALRARYQLAATDVKGLDHDLAYRAIAGGSIEAMDLYATDPEIRKYDLVVLEDDLHVFPRYDAVLLYRRDVAGWAPGAIGTLERLRGRIDAPAMTALNARVKLDHLPESQVAAAFLASTFGVATDARPPSAARAILQRAAEHLWLVSLSLLAAILVAIPLGVVAAGRPRFGQALLAVVGIIQTVPSLALLVFMIPLLGIGALPAMVALFLYSLLPIVRNTHAGLESIPPALRESAEALGLPPGAILRRVSLPLASPLILAGIKSAAVINVGTATLGALIGAGGFGQPIFTGIRLDDIGLILQGAIPASLLALLIQGLFEIVERTIVPKGLRLRGPS